MPGNKRARKQLRVKPQNPAGTKRLRRFIRDATGESLEYRRELLRRTRRTQA